MPARRTGAVQQAQNCASSHPQRSAARESTSTPSSVP